MENTSMKPDKSLTIEYVPCDHLSQLYLGLKRLAARNYIDLRLQRVKSPDDLKPVVKATLETPSHGRVRIVYDTLDGFNWLDDLTETENLQHFRDTFKTDFYFKRSFNERLLKFAPPQCTVMPLGLIFPVIDDVELPSRLSPNSISGLLNRLRPRNDDQTQRAPRITFDYPPICHQKSKVLFLTALSNPSVVPAGRHRDERLKNNELRIDAVRHVRKTFGLHCTAGLSDNEVSRKVAPDLVMPSSNTNRESFSKLVKEHNICVTTSGLHGSIGFRFAEYVMASRAIISQPLVYAPAGNLTEGVNFLGFRTPPELCERAEQLMSNRLQMEEMMRRNYQYSLAYIHPEQHALQTLLAAQAFQQSIDEA